MFATIWNFSKKYLLLLILATFLAAPDLAILPFLGLPFLGQAFLGQAEAQVKSSELSYGRKKPRKKTRKARKKNFKQIKKKKFKYTGDSNPWQGKRYCLGEYSLYPRPSTLDLFQYLGSIGNTKYGYPWYARANVGKVCSSSHYLNGGKAEGWMQGGSQGTFSENLYAGTRYVFPYTGGVLYPCSGSGGTFSGNLWVYVRYREYQTKNYKGQWHLGDLAFCSTSSCQWYRILTC